MKKKFPSWKTDAEAEEFVDNAVELKSV